MDAPVRADDAPVLDLQPSNDCFLEDVVAGLSSPDKTLPCKYFYDERGAVLFEAICEQPEYYPPSVELALLESRLSEIGDLAGQKAVVIEPGSGAGIKTEKLLAALDEPSCFVPIDISREQLQRVGNELNKQFPALTVQPICADFTQTLSLPALPADSAKRIVYFPGSTIGNFSSDAAVQFLSHLRSLAGPDSALLIGVDTKKSEAKLHAAYNDTAGVTAEFNLNLLERINAELAGNFVIDQFHHEARWNADLGAIQMLLISDCDQQVSIGNQSFKFVRGETICTEHSHKYEPQEFQRLAEQAGWSAQELWLDQEKLFSLHWLKAKA